MAQYLTTDELSVRIKFDPRYIRERLKGRVLREGVHYIRPFGGRKILFIWEAVEQVMLKPPVDSGPIPLRKGPRR